MSYHKSGRSSTFVGIGIAFFVSVCLCVCSCFSTVSSSCSAFERLDGGPADDEGSRFRLFSGLEERARDPVELDCDRKNSSIVCLRFLLPLTCETSPKNVSTNDKDLSSRSRVGCCTTIDKDMS